jgi:acetolactate synthase-1/2/3 large subunit
LPPNDPHLVGTFYNTNFERSIINRADLLVAVNLEANDILNRPWSYEIPTIAVDRDPNVESFVPTTHRLTGDVAAILSTLVGPAAPDVTGNGRADGWTPADVGAYRTYVESAFVRGDGGSGITIPDVVRYLRDAAPDAIVTVDAGFGKPIVSMLWPTASTRTYYASHGLSTMGYAIPSANALKALEPERTVLAFLGDGSLLMSAPEIAVASELGIAPIYVVWLDDALLQIRLKQRRQGARATGTAIGRQSCEAVAAAFGARGFDVTDLAELRAAFEVARTSEVPSLIGIRVDTTPAAEWFEVLRG